MTSVLYIVTVRPKKKKKEIKHKILRTVHTTYKKGKKKRVRGFKTQVALKNFSAGISHNNDNRSRKIIPQNACGKGKIKKERAKIRKERTPKVTSKWSIQSKTIWNDVVSHAWQHNSSYLKGAKIRHATVKKWFFLYRDTKRAVDDRSQLANSQVKAGGETHRVPP